jgi:peptidoglycan/xylan/chitin deacetylase (PgdA/CDA1 family)
MYHGITRKDYNPPVWTQLPERIFCDQLEYLKQNYDILSMSKMISILESEGDFPERSAMITFDDGLKNNYTVAYPILKKYSLAATIFLTIDFINTKGFFWFDELFFLVRQAVKQGYDFSDIDIIKDGNHRTDDIFELYRCIVEKMKRIPCHINKKVMEKIRRKVNIDMNDFYEDFSLLRWDEVLEMKDSGLIDFGVHTSTHRILTGLQEDEWEKEIHEPKVRLSNMLGQEVLSFCYPNGRPNVDFDEKHEEYLRKCGYRCAFCTESLLNDRGVNHYRIGRIPAGNDFMSNFNFFKLNTSGAIKGLKGGCI